MGVFDDNKFEQLDWMTQVTETIESELNAILACLPDEIIVDFNMLATMLRHHVVSNDLKIYNNDVTRHIVQQYNSTGYRMSWDEERHIFSCFKFSVTEPLILDYENHQLTGQIKLIKITKTIEDSVLQSLMGHKGLEAIVRGATSDMNLARANEIIEILGNCELALKGRSARRKLYAIRDRLKKIFETNEWRIRDTALADKVGFWISDYISNGNLAALTNFCKLKVMTHNSMPIYSIKEEV